MRQYCLCLLAVVFLQSAVMGNNSNLPDECCFRYYGRKIPIAKIDAYIETRVECSKSATIFTTVKGNRICVNSQLRWVKNAMKAIDERNL